MVDFANDRSHWRNRSPCITRSMVEGVKSAEVPVGEWKREVDVDTGKEYDVFRSNTDGSELDRRAADLVPDEDRQEEEKAVDAPESNAYERRLPLYRAPLGTRVQIENTRFDKPDQPGSYSNSTPSKYSYGEIVGRSQNGVIQKVRYDGYEDPMRSDWRHLEYEVADSNGAGDANVNAGDASVQQADFSDATVQQDASQIDEQPKSQATDVPNGAVFDPDLMASMMAAVAKNY